VCSSGEEEVSLDFKFVPDWQLEFFRGVALDLWRSAMTPQQTAAEVDFLVKTLGVNVPARILDVPCGNGRHSVQLARRGYRVTGVDLSKEFIAEAESSSASLPASWICADMRQLPWSEEFDGAFCFGNSFGYLSPEEAPQFLLAISRTLKRGSRFILETGMAAESILPNLQPIRWYKVDDIYMLSANKYHPREARLDIEYTFIRDGKVDVRPSSSYVLSANQICRMCSDAGLEVTELLGSVGGEAYGLASGRLILVAVKR
jgi:SAM-dependent methyltransferase